MLITEETIRNLEKEFETNQKILTALSDETRQYLLTIMLSMECSGSRVVDIAAKTKLSRPAVSHHMQILKNAGIVKSRKEGRLIYYYLEPDNGKNRESHLPARKHKGNNKISAGQRRRQLKEAQNDFNRSNRKPPCGKILHKQKN